LNISLLPAVVAAAKAAEVAVVAALVDLELAQGLWQLPNPMQSLLEVEVQQHHLVIHRAAKEMIQFFQLLHRQVVEAEEETDSLLPEIMVDQEAAVGTKQQLVELALLGKEIMVEEVLISHNSMVVVVAALAQLA
jgi:hypothetical protein